MEDYNILNVCTFDFSDAYRVALKKISVASLFKNIPKRLIRTQLCALPGCQKGTSSSRNCIRTFDCKT